MPTNLFYTVTIPVCLWFITKEKKAKNAHDRKNEILFIDARRLGAMVTRKHRKLSEEEIKLVADTYHKWKYDNGYTDIQGFCKVSQLEEVRQHEYILTPGRYVGLEAESIDSEPFENKMQRLTSELAEMFAKSNHLQDEVRQKLGLVGFEF